MEYDLQQPYVAQYKTLTKEESIKLVGVSRLPFEPKAEKLGEFSKMLWGSNGGLDFEPSYSTELEEDEETLKLKLYFPYLDSVELEDDSYKVDGFMKNMIFIRHEELKNMKIKRKQKTSKGATYTFVR